MLWMQLMSDGWWVLLAAGLAVFIAGLWLALRRRERGLAAAIRRRYQGREPRALARANFFGLASKGMTQVRGSGLLALAEGELYFVMLWPRREVAIPLPAIQSLETPRSHLGKTKGRKLLKVVFKDAAGREDAAAWLVADLDAWRARLEAAQAGHPGA